MPQPENPPLNAPDNEHKPMFQEPATTGGSRLPWQVYAVVAVALLVGLAGVIRQNALRKSAANPHVLRTADPYAASLAIAGLEMSEASNGANEKATYIDGKITNNGSRTLTGITAQAIFTLDPASVPSNGAVNLNAAGAQAAPGPPTYVETLSLPVIRTREPYVDLQSIADAPIKPGETREFRLIFEKTPDGWDTQAPRISIVNVR